MRPTKILLWIVVLGTMILPGCVELPTAITPQDAAATPEMVLPRADVISVAVSGNPGAYQFRVEISSPDEGCGQYADWWEVLSQDGELLYRRILTHSHVNEQPFTRSGGPVVVGVDEVVIVRAHMHPGGFGRQAMKGSAQTGFEEMTLESGFAAGVDADPPQPEGCDF